MAALVVLAVRLALAVVFLYIVYDLLKSHPTPTPKHHFQKPMFKWEEGTRND